MDYSSYTRNNKYYAGSEEKFGITIDDVDYIIKFQKSSETGLLNNTISEYIGCHIFGMLDMNVQNTYLGTYQGRNIVLLEDFIKENQQFVPFNERYQYPRASPGPRRRCLLFRPKGRGISPCFPGTRSVMEACFRYSRFVGE
ncbi:MAG: hypothetical protein JEY71_04270 [Sphaerochaeta sp.]|nr:hypothetical protein [Sphaerochaeta sp.]